MGVLSNTEFVQLVDKYTAAMLTCVPSVLGSATTSSTPGFGDSTIAQGSSLDYGMQRKFRDARLIVAAFNDPDIQQALLSSITNAALQAPLQKQLSTDFNTVYSNLQTLCTSAGLTGVTSLDLFASYYNTGGGGSWQALLPPDWINLYSNLNGGASPNAYNIYAPPDTGTPGRGTYNLGTSTFVAGSALNTSKYAGWLEIFGVCTGNITVTGTGTITLSANGNTANGTINAPTPYTGTFSSHQLTYSTASNISSGNVFSFTVPANDIITAITGVQISNMSGGTFYLFGMSPTAAPAGAPAGLTGVVVPSGITRTSPPS